MTDHTETIATIVVCEDDDATLDLLCEHLAADRFQALSASTATDALRLCRHNHPDLLLLDLALPDASGSEVLRRIRGSEAGHPRCDPQLPIIVLSGRSAVSDRTCGLELGADDYVQKPFSYEEFRARIDAVLRRHKGRRDKPGGAPRGTGEGEVGPAVPLAEELVDELLCTAVVLDEVLSGLLADLPENAFPGERNVEVLLEMIAGSIAPAVAAAGTDDSRAAIALVAAMRERVLADLHHVVEMIRKDPS